MFSVSSHRRLFRPVTRVICALVVLVGPQFAIAQTDTNVPLNENVDPRLNEIVEIIKTRMKAEQPGNLLRDTEKVSKDEIYLEHIENIQKAAYSDTAQNISEALAEFNKVYQADTTVSLKNISSLYQEYAELIRTDGSADDLQRLTTRYSESGSWFERQMALTQSSYLHSISLERQAALQKAQQALALIPERSEPDPYSRYAKRRVTSMIAHFHNLQGNSDLALIASLDYLRLYSDDPDPNSEVDLINNLIYSYSVGRNHDAQLFLTQALLEIEESRTSSVIGLSEMRIAGVMNALGRFQEALEYANLALEKGENLSVVRSSNVFKAIALAGLGRKDQAIEAAADAAVNLDKKHMLETETRQGDLYLAFLLAQSEDTAYATQLFNRQLDVTAQKFVGNNSRDTTAMLAELENSRVRQAERVAAAAREAQLQALTIDRQKKLNRVLIALLVMLGCAAVTLVIFIRYRGKIVRQLEIKTIEAASAEKLKTEFLGMISHELRTPLNGIIGISDFLANYHDDPDIRQKTDIILRSGNELLSVVESLTDMARLDAGQLSLAPHDTDLLKSLAVVPEAWTEQAEAKGLTFTHFIDPKITEHHVDEDRLIQCLNILLDNAIRFTKTGRVHLHITGQETAEGDLTGLRAIVADTGQGMSELVQSRLFTPFMQADTSRKRNHMGTGLSLAIAYALAEMMGGDLTVNSREGRGSEFKLDIALGAAEQKVTPAKTEPADNSAPEEQSLSYPAADSLPVDASPVLGIPVLDGSDGPMREVHDLMQPHGGFPSLHDVEELVLPTPAQGRQNILVVDDLESNRDILRLILETQGHSCSEAADGLAALEALESQPFDLIVLDIHMTPMDGVETLQRIRGSQKPYADIPVVALTADNAASTNAACMEAGADIFLVKPVRQDELLRAVSYLHSAEPTRMLSG